MTLFNKLILIFSVLVLFPFISNCQIRKMDSPLLKKGSGYYIDNDGNKIDGEIKISCAMAISFADVVMPKIEIKIGNSSYEKIYFDQIQKVVMGTDTFIRSSGRTIVFTSSFSKEVIKEELIYDMLYKEISGKINYYRRYWYSSGRSATDIIEVENQDFKEIYWNHKEKHEFKEYVLNLIKDNPKVYDKWEGKSPFKLYNKIDKIIAEYNTL